MKLVPKALDCGCLQPLSLSAACCTLYRDEVAKLLGVVALRVIVTIATAGCGLFKAAAGCTQSKAFGF